MHVFSCTYLLEAVFNAELAVLVVKPTLVMVYISAVFGKSGKSVNSGNRYFPEGCCEMGSMPGLVEDLGPYAGPNVQR